MGITNPNILLIGYNRPNFIQKNLRHLDNLGFKNIFIHIDGPKNEDDKKSQNQIHGIIEEFELIPKTTFEESNLGIIKSIPNAIDKYFLNYEEDLLIIEDDVIVSINSLGFIEKYKKSWRKIRIYFSFH